MIDDSVLAFSRRHLLATTAGAATLLLVGPGAAAELVDGRKVGRAQLFDPGWLFHRGEGTGFEAPDLDDSGWRSVDLPHDWSIEDLPQQPPDPERIVGPFDKTAEGGTATGFTVGGEGWYRKRFRLPPTGAGHAEILFEGVYMNSDVWLNGHHLGVHPNGYTPFAYDLTPYLSPSGDNVLAVRVRNLGRNSRWYSGSGIYRHVWLDVLPEPARIARWGVGVTTRRITDTGAEIEIGTRIEDLAAGLTLVSRVKDDAGRTVWEVSLPAQPEVLQQLTIKAPRLWSPNTPALYTLETELRRGQMVLDQYLTPFGVRIVAFDATRGMTINGAPIKLRGGCIHHDNGLLGAASFDAAEERKVRLLKARGYNAVRPSHNLFSPAFLRACDRLGMLVVEETFDVWRQGKRPQDYSVYFDDQWRSDLAAIVLGARNHPSIIMWSIGNEIPGRNEPGGVELQWRVANEAHRLDPTRPVTAAVNGFPGTMVTPSDKTARSGFGGVPDRTSTVFLDVVGYNYKLADYEGDHKLFPQRVFMGTESLPKDVFAIWELTDRTPWLIGDFVWTAMDYLGEAGIGGSAVLPASANTNPLAAFASWPWVDADCGDIDLIGEQKPPSLARDVAWGLSQLEMAVQRPVPEGQVEVTRRWGWSDELQSWTWPGAEGKPLTVRIYTSGDRVELRLDGRKIDGKSVTAADLKQIQFKVPYSPGTLEAVAFRDGHEIARKHLTTAGAPAMVRLIPEQHNGSGRGDVSYVAVEIVDFDGRVVPDAAQQIQLSIEGTGELIAFGSADPFAVGGFQSPTAQTWHGRALVVIRGKGRPGSVKITARGERLKSGVTSLRLA